MNFPRETKIMGAARHFRVDRTRLYGCELDRRFNLNNPGNLPEKELFAILEATNYRRLFSIDSPERVRVPMSGLAYGSLRGAFNPHGAPKL